MQTDAAHTTDTAQHLIQVKASQVGHLEHLKEEGKLHIVVQACRPSTWSRRKGIKG